MYMEQQKKNYTYIGLLGVTPHPIDGHARQAYRNTFQQVNSIKYWRYRFEKIIHILVNPLPDLDIIL